MNKISELKKLLDIAENKAFRKPGFERFFESLPETITLNPNKVTFNKGISNIVLGSPGIKPPVVTYKPENIHTSPVAEIAFEMPGGSKTLVISTRLQSGVKYDRKTFKAEFEKSLSMFVKKTGIVVDKFSWYGSLPRYEEPVDLSLIDEE